MIRSLLAAIDGLCRLCAYAAALLVVLLAALGLAEILARALFNYSIPFALEYGSYFLGLVMFMGLGWALREGAHIRLSLVPERLSPRQRRGLEFVLTAVGLVISLYASVALVLMVVGTAKLGTVSFYPSRTPLVYPQALFALGMVTLSLALVARLVRIWLGEPTEIGDANDRPAEHI
jgi:TRAP-type C4-dicarboxylate transport system permease small subunit